MIEQNIQSKTLILLPTYNEKNNINYIILKIFSLLPDINILVIDDNSPDGTADVVKEMMLSHSNLKILERKEKTGLGNAYKDAIRKMLDKDFDFFITMDADGSHQPKYLLEFLEEIKEYDLVIGSRYIKGGGVENWELWRRKLSRLGNLYSKVITGLKINDLTAGFLCIRKEVLERLELDSIGSSGYSFLIELKYYLIHDIRAKVKEIPILFKRRREGESKISNLIISEGLLAPWFLFFKYGRKNSLPDLSVRKK